MRYHRRDYIAGFLGFLFFLALLMFFLVPSFGDSLIEFLVDRDGAKKNITSLYSIVEGQFDETLYLKIESQRLMSVRRVEIKVHEFGSGNIYTFEVDNPADFFKQYSETEWEAWFGYHDFKGLHNFEDVYKIEIIYLRGLIVEKILDDWGERKSLKSVVNYTDEEMPSSNQNSEDILPATGSPSSSSSGSGGGSGSSSGSNVVCSCSNKCVGEIYHTLGNCPSGSSTCNYQTINCSGYYEEEFLEEFIWEVDSDNECIEKEYQKINITGSSCSINGCVNLSRIELRETGDYDIFSYKGESCEGGSGICNVGVCEHICIPDCSGKECGDDGCGGSCGECENYCLLNVFYYSIGCNLFSCGFQSINCNDYNGEVSKNNFRYIENSPDVCKVQEQEEFNVTESLCGLFGCDNNFHIEWRNTENITNIEDGTLCDDGNIWTFGTECQAGVCSGGESFEYLEISNCGELNSSGKYILSEDIENNTYTSSCISIESHDVILDCNGSSIKSTQNLPAIYSNYSNLTIQNCNISVGAGSPGFGIYLWETHETRVLNNTLNEMYTGVYLRSNSTNNLIENNTFINVVQNCVHLLTSTNVTIRNNLFYPNNYGILLTFSQENNILNNQFIGGFDGIEIRSFNQNYSGGHNLIENNYFNGMGQSGIYIDETSNNTIKNNTLTNISAMGVGLFQTQNNTILDNNISKVIGEGSWFSPLGIGISLIDSNYNYILNNLAIENEIGIEIIRNSVFTNISDNVLTGNVFCSNSVDDLFCDVEQNNIDENYCDNDFNNGCGGVCLICI